MNVVFKLDTQTQEKQDNRLKMIAMNYNILESVNELGKAMAASGHSC